jgi:hypothetical protein
MGGGEDTRNGMMWQEGQQNCMVDTGEGSSIHPGSSNSRNNISHGNDTTTGQGGQQSAKRRMVGRGSSDGSGEVWDGTAGRGGFEMRNDANIWQGGGYNGEEQWERSRWGGGQGGAANGSNQSSGCNMGGAHAVSDWPEGCGLQPGPSGGRMFQSSNQGMQGNQGYYPAGRDDGDMFTPAKGSNVEGGQRQQSCNQQWQGLQGGGREPVASPDE